MLQCSDFFADDYAPPAAKTQWLAVFYLCIPTGYALGYIFGGLVAVPLGWRAPFLLEALAMIPFILYCSFAPPIDIRGTKDKGSAPSTHINKHGGRKQAKRRAPPR